MRKDKHAWCSRLEFLQHVFFRMQSAVATVHFFLNATSCRVALAGDVPPAGADSPLGPEAAPFAVASPLWKSGEDWAGPFAFLEPLASSGVLSRLNDREVPLMLAEAERPPTDFSSYHPVAAKR